MVRVARVRTRADEAAPTRLRMRVCRRLYASLMKAMNYRTQACPRTRASPQGTWDCRSPCPRPACADATAAASRSSSYPGVSTSSAAICPWRSSITQLLRFPRILAVPLLCRASCAQSVEHPLQQHTQEMLERDRRSTPTGVARLAPGRELGQDRIDQRADRPQRTVGWNAVFDRHVAA